MSGALRHLDGWSRANLILSAASDPAFQALLHRDAEAARRALATKIGVDASEIPADAFERARRVAIAAARPDQVPTTGPPERVTLWPIERFSQALAQLVELGFRAELPPKTARFAWLPKEVSVDPQTQMELHRAIDIGSMLGLIEPLVNAVAPDETPRRLLQCSHLRELLSAEQAKALAISAREMNAGVFSAPCYDLAAALAERRAIPLSERARLPGVPKVTHYGQRASELDGYPAAQRLDRAETTVGHTVTLDSGFSSTFENQAPVGAYGPKLSYAIVEAVQIALNDAEPIIAKLEASEAAQALFGASTLQRSAADLVREGIVSIGQTLALLLVKAPPGIGLDDLLGLIAKDGLVAHVAAQAPFGMIGPMIASGRVPSDPVSFDDAGRPQVPLSLRDLTRDIHSRRQIVSAEASSSETFGNAKDHRTQTLMGCPVAGRAPKIGADGRVETRAEPALVGLASEVVDLVRRILAEDARP